MPEGVEVRFDWSRNMVASGDAVVVLRNSEADLFRILSGDPGRVVTMDRIARAQWGMDPPDGWPQALRVLVCRLRQKLRPLDITIENLRSKGYRLIVSGPLEKL